MPSPDEFGDLHPLVAIVFTEILHERARQLATMGEVDHEDSSPLTLALGATVKRQAEIVRRDPQWWTADGGPWAAVFASDAAQVLTAEGDDLEQALVQALTTAVGWLVARRKRVDGGNRAVRFLHDHARGAPAREGLDGVVDETLARLNGWLDAGGITRSGQMVLALTLRPRELATEPAPKAGKVIELASRRAAP